MSTNIFSSLSGNYDYMSSMSSLIGDYSQIKNGSYGSLMKSYVNKVGNKAALNAYRETGSTTVATDSSETSASAFSSSTKSIPKSNFVDSLGGGKKAESSDSYAKYKSSWLDDQLKQYDKDANKTTAADTSVAYDTTI
ncbi:hypothetical protein [Butyrivibrio sp. VCB2006]|uniref:hypothetical protein n=1 Tax=Butyrivibrio sp. VCB2006 TaxID=1280679 RepID=UPI00040B5E70|nr:hypothetical protein [Butyrivibrio sp. VCB2006]